MPPVKPMLAKLAADIPAGQLYEPKWDGFRSVVFRDGDEVQIGSRNERPMTRYFPEVVAAVLANLPERCVVDGEIILIDPAADRLDFEALQRRLHPATSRVSRLSRESPASLVVFDLLALGDESLCEQPFAHRRDLLEQAVKEAKAPLHLTPVTDDPRQAAEWFDLFEGAGLDGIIAKRADLRYQQDKRVMTKVKHVRTVDCVVAGYRSHKNDPQAIGSLLLGLYDDAAALQSVGVIGALPMATRRALFLELAPLVIPVQDHPWAWAAREDASATRVNASRWNAGKDLSFAPLRPERVVEARYDYLEGTRFRHTAQFVRWRPDRDAASCTFGQLETPPGFAVTDVLR